MEPKPFILGEILGNTSERTLKELSNALFQGAVAFLVPPSYLPIWRKCWKRQNLTFGELWWPDLWPGLKIHWSLSVIIFDALSIATYRVSLRGPGAELEGNVKTAPQHDTENRPPARCELTLFRKVWAPILFGPFFLKSCPRKAKSVVPALIDCCKRWDIPGLVAGRSKRWGISSFHPPSRCSDDLEQTYHAAASPEVLQW